MTKSFTYSCRDCEGMATCPGEVTGATKDEVWKLVELHAVIAHGEDPSSWDDETRQYLETLIKQR